MSNFYKKQGLSPKVTEMKIVQRIFLLLILATAHPSFVGGLPLATYDDAVVVEGLLSLGLADISRFSASEQTKLISIGGQLAAIVNAGPGSFGGTGVTTVLANALDLVAILSSGLCDGFLE